jgi:anti-sigma factor (TIGR02949 family)
MSPEECRDVFAMLSEYIDGELPAGTCEQIARHIEDCPPCVEFVDSLRKSIGAFRDCGLAEEPPPLSQEAKARLARAYRDMLTRRAG